MSFLGVVILTFGFKIYSQRNLMTRHAPEIFGATLLSSLFSLFGTAAAGKLLGLAPELTRAIVPRSVTVALAMPIAQQLQVADVSITAVVVLLTGESVWCVCGGGLLFVGSFDGSGRMFVGGWVGVDGVSGYM